MRYFFLCLFILFNVSLAYSQTTEVESDYRSFLLRLGFENYADQARRALRDEKKAARNGEKYLDEFKVETLETNIGRYRVIDYARELAVILLSQTHDYLNDSESYVDRERLIELTARMINLQPFNPAFEIPQYILNIDDPEEREAEKSSYYFHRAQVVLEAHTRYVFNDILMTLFSADDIRLFHRLKEEVKLRRGRLRLRGQDSSQISDIEYYERILGEWARKNSSQHSDSWGSLTPDEIQRSVNFEMRGIAIDGLKRMQTVNRLLDRMMMSIYLDHEMGQTRYLGKALAAGILKWAMSNEEKVDGKYPIYEELREAVARHGNNLDNFVGNRLTFEDRGSIAQSENQTRVIDFENGDIIFERSANLSRQGMGITAGSRPNWRNGWYTYWRGLAGNILGIFAVVTEEQRRDGLSWVEKARHWLARQTWIEAGLSHVGIARVQTDSDTGIKMVWAVDNYPNFENGGIRFIGMETFAQPGPYVRVGRARYDHRRFYRYVQKSVRNQRKKDESLARRYRRDHPNASEQEVEEYLEREFRRAWRTSDVYEDGTPVFFEKIISRAEFYQMHDLSHYDNDVERWAQNFWRRTTEHIKDMGVKHGIGFDYGFMAAAGTAYCSSTVLIGALQATGIDIEQHQGDFHPLVKIIAKLPYFRNLSLVEDLRVGERLVAPASLAVQSYARNFEQATFWPRSFEDIIKESYQPILFPYIQDFDGGEEMVQKTDDLHKFDRQKMRETLDEYSEVLAEHGGKAVLFHVLERGGMTEERYFRLHQERQRQRRHRRGLARGERGIPELRQVRGFVSSFIDKCKSTFKGLLGA